MCVYVHAASLTAEQVPDSPLGLVLSVIRRSADCPARYFHLRLSAFVIRSEPIAIENVVRAQSFTMPSDFMTDGISHLSQKLAGLAILSNADTFWITIVNKSTVLLPFK